MSKIFHSIKAKEVFPAHLNAEALSGMMVIAHEHKISFTSNSIK